MVSGRVVSMMDRRGGQKRPVAFALIADESHAFIVATASSTAFS